MLNLHQRVAIAPKPVSAHLLKPWNMMIYMGADNNLRHESVHILSKIADIGEVLNIDVHAQLDAGNIATRYNFKKLWENRANRLDNFPESVLPAPTDVQSAFVSERLKSFLFDTINPESNNIVVLSGHGAGAVGDFLNSDTHYPGALSVPSLRALLESVRDRVGNKIDILGMDSCLMSMVEVAHEVQDVATFIVGAEGYARNTGWPYRLILKAIHDEPNLPAKKLARKIVKAYIDYYSLYTISGISVDHSACDLSRINVLTNALSALSEILTSKLSLRSIENAVLLAHWRAQSYKFEQHVDIWDFCNLLQKDCDDQEVKAACEEVKMAIDSLVIISCYSGVEFQHSHGLSIYFPWSKTDLDKSLPYYKNLSFDHATKWSQFLNAYGEKTQREYRNDCPYKAGKSELLTMKIEYEFGVSGISNVRTTR